MLGYTQLAMAQPTINSAKPRPTPSPTATARQCDSVIKKCDDTLKEKNKALDLADLALKKCQDQNAAKNKELDSLRESNSAWYKNPFIVGIIGIAAGVVLGKTVIFK